MKVKLLTITRNAEKSIETAGRTAYNSKKQNKRISSSFIKMLIKREHLSVLEHASATFRISGVSRALTHQLVRHRLASFTQRSQRYVNEEQFGYVEPPEIKNNMDAHKIFIQCMKDLQNAYTNLHKTGIKKEDARFVLPNAVQSELVMSANFRQWRHILSLRGEKHAQWEIRILMIKILRILKKHAPNVFEDFHIIKKKNIIERHSE